MFILAVGLLIQWRNAYIYIGLSFDGFVKILKMQIPSIHILKYTAQVLGVILALLDDCDDSVQLTAVSCLLVVRSLSSGVCFGFIVHSKFNYLFFVVVLL